jgi:hypothetical protein
MNKILNLPYAYIIELFVNTFNTHLHQIMTLIDIWMWSIFIQDFTDLMSILKNTPRDTHIIFNCQMGTLEQEHKRKRKSISSSDLWVCCLLMSLEGRGRTTTGMVIATILSYWHHKLTPSVNVPKTTVDFKTIMRLTRALRNGQHAKKLTDAAIYQCRSISSPSHFSSHSWMFNFLYLSLTLPSSH